MVSLGTINADVGQRFFATVIEALGDQPYQVVLAAPDELIAGPVPDNVLVRPYLPQLALLDRVDAVVSHGGHNTVCETLSHGRPLVLAPIRDDQPIVAQQVVDAGAGLRVKFGRVRAPELRSAVEAVLDDPNFTRCARAVRDTFAAAGGSSTAADHLEKLT
jgi:MGT family glycosyltransferase